MRPGSSCPPEPGAADDGESRTVHLKKLSQGRQVCVTRSTGHIGLVTVRGFSSEDSPSTYMTLDLPVRHNAVGSGSGN
ncbi:hypothetical protein ACFU8Q_35655 [Streptomyces sp. NPDC057543]|uniref:hypothetical protein n=1 Tax=Streptomyces sp. NPDC057543 TaxID=3346163 RepID=UPI0036772CFE